MSDSSSDDFSSDEGPNTRPGVHDDDDDDDEFAFGTETKTSAKAGGDNKVYKDQHWDEAMAVSEDEESIEDSSMSFDQAAAGGGGDDESSSEEESSSEDDSQSAASPPKGQAAPRQQQQEASESDEGDSSSDSSSSSDDEESRDDTGAASAYNPADYAHLQVSNEIKDLFDYISRHQPNDIELETKLTPFIPDFIPAVGEIDSFLKVPRPDQKDDGLGLTVLDEPAVNQSDPTALDIKLRVMSKHSGVKAMTVRSIENADKHPKKITSWITNIEDVHRKKPPPVVKYSKNMPDIETLMQVWPSELEELLRDVPLPQAELDMSLEEYARVVCAILDIPVYDKLKESLHVLFTLYAEFKSNSHFQAIN